jgi:D-glycero-alpha-D-manno-heptose-7-phosphate kinase
MLIARAPVRVSFAGGGTDFEGYYARFGGFVISAAIDKYFYVFLAVTRRENIQIMSSDYQTFYRQNAGEEMLWDGDLALPRAVLNYFDIREGLSMFLASQVPPGTGLGSSSTVTVSIIKAVSSLLGLGLSKQDVAELACTIEIDKLTMPIGKQDQYAAAYGGINAITFSREGVRVEPLTLSPETLEGLESNILLFYTGAAREASQTLSTQNDSVRAGDPAVLDSLHSIKSMAQDTRRCFETGTLDLYGEILDASWERKKRLAPGISTPRIDEYYEIARAQGAIGGKIAGAGGGGFLMLYCDRGAGPRVTEALERIGLRRMDFSIDFDGARILLNNAIPFTVPRNA